MNRSTSIFYGLTKEDENTSTEILCNLLKYRYFRDILFSYLKIDMNAIDSIDLNHCSTQIRYNTGIPDLVITNSKAYYLIENKIRIDTPLQDNQIYSYPEMVINSKKPYKGQIFILPKNYKHLDKIENAKLKYSFIKIVIWDDLIRYLFSYDLQKDSYIIAEALNLLSELIIKSSIDTILSPYEVAMLYNPKDIHESLKVMCKIIQLVEKSGKMIIDGIGSDFELSTWANDFYDDTTKGRYIKYKKNDDIFIGLNLNLVDKGAQYWEYILSVALKKDTLNENWNIDTSRFEYCEDSDWIYVKIKKEIIINEDQQNSFSNEVIDIINDIFKNNCA